MTFLDEDVAYRRVCEWAALQRSVSTTRLQLRFRLGYKAASKLMQRMVANGVISLPPTHLN